VPAHHGAEPYPPPKLPRLCSLVAPSGMVPGAAGVPGAKAGQAGSAGAHLASDPQWMRILRFFTVWCFLGAVSGLFTQG